MRGFLHCRAGGNSSLYNINRRTPRFPRPGRALKFHCIGCRADLKFYSAAFHWTPRRTHCADGLRFLVCLFASLGRWKGTAFTTLLYVGVPHGCSGQADSLRFLALLIVRLGGLGGRCSHTLLFIFYTYIVHLWYHILPFTCCYDSSPMRCPRPRVACSRMV